MFRYLLMVSNAMCVVFYGDDTQCRKRQRLFLLCIVSIFSIHSSVYRSWKESPALVQHSSDEPGELTQ